MDVVKEDDSVLCPLEGTAERRRQKEKEEEQD